MARASRTNSDECVRLENVFGSIYPASDHVITMLTEANRDGDARADEASRASEAQDQVFRFTENDINPSLASHLMCGLASPLLPVWSGAAPAAAP